MKSPAQRYLWRQPLGLLHHSQCPTAGQWRTRETKRLQTRNTGKNQFPSRIPFPSKTLKTWSLSKRQLSKYLPTLSHIVDRDLRGKNWQVIWDSKRHCCCSTSGKTAQLLLYCRTVLSLYLHQKCRMALRLFLLRLFPLMCLNYCCASGFHGSDSFGHENAIQCITDLHNSTKSVH